MPPARRLTAARGCEDGTVELEIDGSPWCRVDSVLFAQTGLDVGDTVTASLRRRIERRVAEQHALERGARLLGRRAHSRADLQRRLARHVDDASAQHAVKRLDELGMVDDGRYATDVVQHRLARGWGPLRIRHDLEQAGLPPALIETIVGEIDAQRLCEAEQIAIGERAGDQAWRRLVSRGFEPESLEGRYGVDPSNL